MRCDAAPLCLDQTCVACRRKEGIDKSPQRECLGVPPPPLSLESVEIMVLAKRNGEHCPRTVPVLIPGGLHGALVLHLVSTARSRPPSNRVDAPRISLRYCKTQRPDRSRSSPLSADRETRAVSARLPWRAIASAACRGGVRLTSNPAHGATRITPEAGACLAHQSMPGPSPSRRCIFQGRRAVMTITTPWWSRVNMSPHASPHIHCLVASVVPRWPAAIAAHLI